MLTFVRLVGVLGAIGCAILIGVILITPKTFERTALGFAKQQIETELKARYPGLADDKTGSAAKLLSKALGKQQDQLRKTADSGLPDLIAKTILAYCGCTNPAKIDARADRIRAGLQARVARLGLAQGRLAEIIKGKYDRIIAALKTDLLIFLSTNLVAFAGVFVVSFAPRERRGLIVIPGLLLIVAAGVSSWIYIAEQDWFYAILFQDYYGFGYAVMMALIFALLLDIILNRARVCLRIAANLPSAMIPQC